MDPYRVSPAVEAPTIAIDLQGNSSAPAITLGGVQTIFFRHEPFIKNPFLARATAWTQHPKLRQVFFQFDASLPYRPSREHRPIPSSIPTTKDCVADRLVAIAKTLVQRGVTVYLVDCNLWHPTWCRVRTDDNIETRFGDKISQDGGDDYLRIITKEDVKKHFDSETHYNIMKNQRA
jgi:hypothetical protein